MLQHGVAGAVAERVVDLLETVEVYVQNRERIVAGAARRRIFLQLAIEIASVRKPCEEVMKGEMLDALLGRLQFAVVGLCEVLGPLKLGVERHFLGHVPIGADQLAVAVAVDEEGRLGADDALGAIAADDPEFMLESRLALDVFHHGPMHTVAVVGMQRLAPGVAVPGARRVLDAVDPQQARVPFDGAGIEIGLEHADP